MRVLTIGFTKKPAQRFFGLLRESGARRVVDVRLKTGSQLAGFAKRDDLAWFLEEICGIEYVHVPDLAPSKELLDDYRKKRIGWSTYEDRFVGLMRDRRIENTVSREIVDGGCLLCSEDQPHHCHRRLIAEYLADCWETLRSNIWECRSLTYGRCSLGILRRRSLVGRRGNVSCRYGLAAAFER